MKNLGELIRLTEWLVGEYPNEQVRYSFGYLFPTGIDSWRGDYSQLALNYTDEGTPMTGEAFLEMLRSAVGKTFNGYKGGDYVMDKSTTIWVANYGHSGWTAVKDIFYRYGYIIIEACYTEY